MRRIAVCFALLMLLCANSKAQEVPKYESFAGFSYLRCEGASETDGSVWWLRRAAITARSRATS